MKDPRVEEQKKPQKRKAQAPLCSTKNNKTSKKVRRENKKKDQKHWQSYRKKNGSPPATASTGANSSCSNSGSQL